MSNEEIVNILKGLEIGTTIEVDIKCLDGILKEVGKYKGDLKQKGYLCSCGGWSCYKSEGYKPCYQFLFTPKGKRRLFIMQIGYSVVGVRVIK